MLKIIISVLCILTFEKINSMEFLNGLADFCNRLGQINGMSQVPQYNQQQALNTRGFHFANARSSSIVPLIRNLANRFM